MYNILYVGKEERDEFSLFEKRFYELTGLNVLIAFSDKIETISDYLFSEISPKLLIIEEKLDQDLSYIKELKSDESFSYLPILLLRDKDTKSTEITTTNFHKVGIDKIIYSDFVMDDLVYICQNTIKYKIRLDILNNQFSEVSEKNITKSIQLDLIKKFIPQTVWNKCENLAKGQELVIPEVEQDLCVIFADLESFTTMSENLSPKAVIEMLNNVFDITSQIIYQNFGDIDKFIGDAFLAVFESPEMALLSSIMIQEEMEIINIDRIKRNLFPLKFRMGVHTGKVIRGSVGGTLRFDNTLIGDPINTTQRLEAMSPSGGILASKDVIDKINIYNFDDIIFSDYVLKGKNKKIKGTLLFDYYKMHPELKKTLFKYRFEIENDNNFQ